MASWLLLEAKTRYETDEIFHARIDLAVETLDFHYTSSHRQKMTRSERNLARSAIALALHLHVCG